MEAGFSSVDKLRGLLLVGVCALGLSACATVNGARDRPGESAAPSAAQTEPENADPRMLELQGRMLAMHDLMHRIQDTKDPEERQRLRQEQARLIQENMEIMLPIMLTLIHQGMGRGAPPGGGEDMAPREDPCGGMGGGDTGGQGGVIVPVPEQAPPGTMPMPEEQILEEAPQRNSSAVLHPGG